MLRTMPLNCETDAITGFDFGPPTGLRQLFHPFDLVFPQFWHNLPTNPISWQAYDVWYAAGITGESA